VCPQCQTANALGDAFCKRCGHALGERSSGQDQSARFSPPQAYTPKHLAERIIDSKAALEGERKRVTVLFADLKGSMELLADRDPEEARKLLDPVLERMIEAVHHYEGTVNQVMGDGSWRSSERRSLTKITPYAPAMRRSACRMLSPATPTTCVEFMASTLRFASV
jgi:class 3 adenylate cyclase